MGYKKEITLFVLAWLLLFLSSCASILNKPTHKTTIETSKPAKIIYKGNVLESNADSTKFKAQLLRSSANVCFDVINDTNNEIVCLHHKYSAAFWSNFLFNYGIGTFIDLNSPKQYGYGAYNYIDFSSGKAVLYHYKPLLKYPKNKNSFYITPTFLLNDYRPGIEISYERKIKPDLGLQVSFLYINNQFSFSNNQNNGYGIALNSRHYVNPYNPTQLYFSIEAGYITQNFNANWDFYMVDSTGDIQNKSFNVDSKEFYFSPKVGLQFVLGERFLIDFYGGLGFKHRRVTHPITINNLWVDPKDPNIYYDRIKPGNTTSLKAILNLRLGFSF